MDSEEFLGRPPHRIANLIKQEQDMTSLLLRYEKDGALEVVRHDFNPVSYTHLTLPTKA